MAKKLSQMTWQQIQDEMSIAGSPEKVTTLAKEMYFMIGERLDTTNVAELINIEFALKKVTAEVRREIRKYEKRTGQKII